MHRRLLFALLVAFALLPAWRATAQSLDNSAAQKIDQAINEHYLATDFKKAESVLLGVVKACGDQCTPQTLAKAWMYIGLVRGSGREDHAGAREAFSKALAVDRTVKLDEALATPDTKSTFRAAAAGGGSGQATAVGPGTAVPGGAPGMACSPNVPEVQTRRPVPVSCASPPNAAQVELFYRIQGVRTFKSVAMQLAGGQVSTVIPCLATSSVGQLELYVLAKDAAGIPVSQWGGPDRPQTIRLVEATTAPPPSLPGQPPPERCKSDVECPPGLPGCVPEGGGGWGDSCTPTEKCKHGLYCKSGLCEPAPECKADADCKTGVCSDGYCQMDANADAAEVPGGYKKNWIGLHIAGDVAIVSGDSLCAMPGWDENFRCFNSSNRLLMVPSLDKAATATDPAIPFWASSTSTTAVYASTRVLLSLDRAIMTNLTAGARVGIAFGGAPSEFLPYHIEVRGAYWIFPLSQPGLKPYVGVAGGMAQVDAKLKATRMRLEGEPLESFDAYKRMGQGFAALALGAIYPLTSSVALQLNINAMYLLPSAGIVVQPSLGGIVGF